LSKPHLIGLSGYAGVGKTTVGTILALDYGYKIAAFADKLRELAAAVSPEYARLVNAMGYERAKAESPFVREFLVALGAGARKVLGADVWVDALLPRHLPPCHFWQEHYPDTVITDVRYANEALRIKQLGGQVWHIERPHIGPANEEEARSIALLPRADRYIANTGSIDFLREEVKRALGE